MTRTPSLETVSVLGATGSIGLNTLDLLARARDRFRVGALTANRDAHSLAALAIEHRAELAVVADEAAYPALREALSGTGIEAAAGPAALIEASERPADRVMAAIVGSAGLAPTLAAVRRGTTVLLANKECLVCAGRLFMETARASGARILPVDSEHSAIFQALLAGPREAVVSVTVTASGGPFRTWNAERLARARPEEAVRHPNWAMGAKISVDSATLMNKGLEVIEAHHLFSLPAHSLSVLVHPESVVHGFVAYADGSVVAQLAAPDMRTPIAYALAWPGRMASPTPTLDLAALGRLTFEEPDLERFSALGLARAALAAGGGAPTVLNAANEVAVDAYLKNRIDFPHIANIVQSVMSEVAGRALPDPASLDEALDLDASARKAAANALERAWARAS